MPRPSNSSRLTNPHQNPVGGGDLTHKKTGGWGMTLIGT